MSESEASPKTRERKREEERRRAAGRSKEVQSPVDKMEIPEVSSGDERERIKVAKRENERDASTLTRSRSVRSEEDGSGSFFEWTRVNKRKVKLTWLVFPLLQAQVWVLRSEEEEEVGRDQSQLVERDRQRRDERRGSLNRVIESPIREIETLTLTLHSEPLVPSSCETQSANASQRRVEFKRKETRRLTVELLSR